MNPAPKQLESRMEPGHQSGLRSRRTTWRAWAVLVLLLLTSWRASADDLDLLGGDGGAGDGGSALDILKTDTPEFSLEEHPAVADLSGLADSVLAPVIGFRHVKPPEPRRNRKGTEVAPPPGGWHWQAGADGNVTPLDGGAITAWLAVPVAGKYRVFLRQRMTPDTAAPITLTLTPVTVVIAQPAGDDAEGDAVEAVTPTVKPRGDALPAFVFGKVALDSSATGADQERRRPLRFESESERLGMPERPAMVWEYVDVTLDVGTWELAIRSNDKSAVIHSVLLTRGAPFRPSFATLPEWNTLSHIYMRFRLHDVTPPLAAGAPVSIVSGLTYHWAGRSLKSQPNETAWGWPIGAVTAKGDGWSPFIDAADAIIPGAGPWSTCNINVGGVSLGQLDIEFAWYPDPAAVMRRVTTGVGAGSARLRVPHGVGYGVNTANAPAWGVWRAEHLAQIRTEEEIIERYFTWAKEAETTLGLSPDHPLPRKLHIFSGNGVLPANRSRATEMLARLGVNWVDGAAPEMVKRLGLHDADIAYHTDDYAGLAKVYAADLKRLELVKMGDEIGTHTAAEVVNANPRKLAAFHAYLGERAAAEGLTMRAYLGLDDPAPLRAIDTLPANPGRYERRLYYDSQVYAHLAAVPSYQATIKGFERHFPNVHVYNNYSPHPVFLTGATMNGSDWFVLPRHQGQTMGWAEDWAYNSSWGLGTSYQCTSFYAAIVECSVRKYDYPSGFYVGVNCGGAANKIFATAARGMTQLHLYDWGPVDNWAEGSNAWSEIQSQYLDVSVATHAIGPADTIIVDGQREPRRIAILYNRSHEILYGGAGRLNHDWMWTYIALQGSGMNVDVIIEEDLNPKDLARYQAVIVGGFALGRPQFQALADWVRAGGLLYADAGALQRDTSGDPLDSASALFGGTQQRLDTNPTRIVAAASDLCGPATEFAFGGQEAYQILPTATPAAGTSGSADGDATVLARYATGEIAATTRTVGKGRVVLAGFPVGWAYVANDRERGPLRPWLAAPFLKVLGRPRADFDLPGVETTLFEHADGLAIMLNRYPATPELPTGHHLSLLPGRAVTSVSSGLRGPLKWRADGDRIVIDVPSLNPVDVIIVK